MVDPRTPGGPERIVEVWRCGKPGCLFEVASRWRPPPHAEHPEDQMVLFKSDLGEHRASPDTDSPRAPSARTRAVVTLVDPESPDPAAATNGTVESRIKDHTTGHSGEGVSHERGDRIVSEGPPDDEQNERQSAQILPANTQLEFSPDDVTGKSASAFDLTDDAMLLMPWIDGVCLTAGRSVGEPLDVVIGALAKHHISIEPHPDPVLIAILESLETPQRSIAEILDDALAPYQPLTLSEVMNPDGFARHGSVLRVASKIAEQTTGDAKIATSHVLAAALVTTELPEQLLEALGCDEVDLRTRLLDVVNVDLAAADKRSWSTALALDELDAYFTSDFVPQRARRRGDLPARQVTDHLEVDVYVTMLAAMITRRSTAMPASIGLFGEWGAGKTYFMELLRQKVHQLSEIASESGSSGPYCRDVIQVTFNAWSYADTNLWASLAADFFGQLADPATDPDDERREQIRESLKEKNEVRQELVRERKSAVERTTYAHKEYADAVAAREQSAQTLDKRLTSAVLADANVKAKISDLGRALGVQSAERVLQIAHDVQGLASDLVATRRVLGVRLLRWPFYLFLVAVAATVAALVLPNGPMNWLSGVALSTAIAFLTTLGFVVDRSTKAVDKLRALAEAAVDAREKYVNGSDDPQILDLEEKLRLAKVEEAVARISLKELDEAVARLNRQLADYEPGRRLYEFIAERAASLDYRGQLGVVSLVRRDFEQLVELMHRWRMASADSDTHEVGKPIDRIVLYIDDLDRCEPEQVVQVLQAVHLLLAMDLFVVVVGVDPRWLLRSLRTRYSSVLSSQGEGNRDEDQFFATSTPRDYLEKIFQVPFILPQMSNAGFKGLLRSFLPQGSATDSQISEAGLPPHSAPLLAEQHSEVADAAAATEIAHRAVLRPITSTAITGNELDLLDLLAPMVTTPRAATRLFNVYGLLRSARDLSPGGHFLGTKDKPGDYQAVVQLLGLLIGEPERLGVMLWGASADDDLGLCKSTQAGSWKDFVESLIPRQHESTEQWANGVSSSIAGQEVDSWRRTVENLREVISHVRLDDLDRYRFWGPQVARFSFELSSFGAR